MSDDIVTRLRDRHATTWHSGALPSIFSAAADEIERLRQALFEIKELHQPMWVSKEAKAAGKEPWGCCWCGTADGSWPCDTRLMADDALAPEQGDNRG